MRSRRMCSREMPRWKLLDRVGWEIYLGGDGHGRERWEPIVGVRITVADGVTYVTGYVDAVRCRRRS